MMNCPNCHKENTWENVDEFRIKKAGMSICKECGFISYPSRWKTPEEIKAHYRKAYRPPPNHNNAFTGQRKIHFHNAFLESLFESWQQKGIDAPVVCDVGAAYGMTLAWIKQVFPKAKVFGTELTTSFRRNAFYEYGITLTEDFDESQKYDLIISYKVLEHMLDPHLEIKKYRDALSANGVLYMSVPTWFDSMSNPGLGGFDLEYYYDPDHINVWSREMFEVMLTREGLEVTKTDYAMYGASYLCKSIEKKEPTKFYKDDVAHVKDCMKKIKDAFMLFHENKFEEAIALWNDYPQAHTSLCEYKRKEINQIGWPAFREKYIERAAKMCPDAPEIFVMWTDFAMRVGEFNEALQKAQESLELKPENPISLQHIINIMREMAIAAQKSGDGIKALEYFAQAREAAAHLRRVSAQHRNEATDLIYFFNAQLPFNGESVAANSTASTGASVTPIKRKAQENELTL